MQKATLVSEATSSEDAEPPPRAGIVDPPAIGTLPLGLECSLGDSVPLPDLVALNPPPHLELVETPSRRRSKPSRQPCVAPPEVEVSSTTSLHKLQLKGDWENWRWQMRNRIRSLAGLRKLFPDLDIPPGASAAAEKFPIAITPYYASLIRTSDVTDPVFLMCVPQAQELFDPPFLTDDPLDEDEDMPVPGLVHRYPRPGPAGRHDDLRGVLPPLHAQARGGTDAKACISTSPSAGKRPSTSRPTPRSTT